MEQLAIGFGLALTIAGLAFLAHTLSFSGAVAAAVMGTIIFGFGGLPGAILLLAFFISSSLLSRLSGRGKASLDEKVARGSVRDAAQVLANGGIAALAILIAALTGQGKVFTGSFWYWVFAASLAAANADTWATELGVLSRGQPVLITTGRPAERGTSGGISLPGTLAALGGAAFIGLLAAALAVQDGSTSLLGYFLGVSLAGLLGSLFDSFLGATIQAVYMCPTCHQETERHPFHTCGTTTTLKRGWRWLNNDWVNVACTLFGAIVIVAMVLIP